MATRGAVESLRSLCARPRPSPLITMARPPMTRGAPAAGTCIAMWRNANYPDVQLPPIPLVAGMGGAGGVALKFLTAVLLTGG